LPYHLHISFSFDDSISLKISGLKSPFLKDDYSRSNLITEHFNSARYSVASFVKILLYTDIAIRPDQLFWHRDLIFGSALAAPSAQAFFHLIWNHSRRLFS